MYLEEKQSVISSRPKDTHAQRMDRGNLGGGKQGVKVQFLRWADLKMSVTLLFKA